MNFTRALLITAIASLFSFTAVADVTVPADNNPVTHAELKALVRQILVDNPDILMDAAKKMHEKQETDDDQRAKSGISKDKNEIFSDAHTPSIGDAKTADITIVEFFDYHCGYCHQLLPTLVKLSAEDKKIRVVFKEFPILSDDSVTAARAALAVNAISKDKYFDFHQALMHHQGKFDDAALADIAVSVNVSPDKMKAKMEDAVVTKELDSNRNIGEDLGIRGTPALIINDQLYPGAMSYEELKKVIGFIRAGTKPDKARS